MLKNKLLPVFLLLFGFANSKVLALTFDLAELSRIVKTTSNEECLILFKTHFLDKNLTNLIINACNLRKGTKKGEPAYDVATPLWDFIGVSEKINKFVADIEPVEDFNLAGVAQYCRIIAAKVLAKLHELDPDGLFSQQDYAEIPVGVLGLDVYKIIKDEPQDDSGVVSTQTSSADEPNIKRTFSDAFSRTDSGSSLSSSSSTVSLTQSSSPEEDQSKLARTPSFSTLSRQPSISYKPKNPKKPKIDRAPKKSTQNAWDKRRTEAENAGKTFYDKDSVANFAAFFSVGK